MPENSTIREEYVIHIRVTSALEFQEDGNPVDDGDARKRAAIFADRYSQTLTQETRAEVTFALDYAFASSLVASHRFKLSFPTYEEWRRWCQIADQAQITLERWAMADWRKCEPKSQRINVSVQRAGVTQQLFGAAPAQTRNDDGEQTSPDKPWYRISYLILAGVFAGIFIGASATSIWLRADSIETRIESLEARTDRLESLTFAERQQAPSFGCSNVCCCTAIQHPCTQRR